MIVVMKPNASQEDIKSVIRKAESLGAQTHPIYGENRTVVALVGDLTHVSREIFDAMDSVAETVRIQEPYKLSSRSAHPHDTIIEVGTVRIGGPDVVIMAGPCSVEGRQQIIEQAYAVKEAGAHILRGGAYKPRTSPYSFQGLGVKGLEYLAEARELTGLPVITEVMTVEELLMCAEYIVSNSNYNVMVCERGIRTYETVTRNTFDLNAVPVLKQRTHLPVVADPSHGTGYREFVPAMSRAAVAAGADALILEVHPDPDNAASDGRQSLDMNEFAKLVESLRRVAEAVDRKVAPPLGTPELVTA